VWIAWRVTLVFLGAFGGGGNSIKPIFTGLLISDMAERYPAVCQAAWAYIQASFEFNNSTIHKGTEKICINPSYNTISAFMEH
jgi:hypothetical protein